MTRHDHWDVTVDNDEQPDYSYYTVNFLDHKSGESAARVLARVYTNFENKAKEVHVERLNEDTLKDVPDSRLLEIAEIEINAAPGLLKYVELPGSHPAFVTEK